MKVVVFLQGRILAPDTIDACNERLQAVRAVDIPGSYLVFFGVQILFAVGLPGDVLSEFESRSVYAVVGAQGRGQCKSDHERRSAAHLEIFRQNIRGIGPQIGPEEFPHRGPG